MLVNRWSILRKALPAARGIKKVSCLVMALCCLHNFCIDQCLARKQEELVAPNTASDAAEIAVSGGITVNQEPSEYRPIELLGAGEHFEGVSEAQRCQFSRRGLIQGERIPRDRLLDMIELGDFTRKVPKGWTKE